MSQSVNIANLFQSAQAEGLLSQQTVNALVVPDVGAAIQAGMGIPAMNVSASEVSLVTMMPDDSGSIQFSGNKVSVIEGHNLVLDALSKTKQVDGILAHTRYLNGEVLFPYSPLDQAVQMDARNYQPNKGTPLYDQTFVLLGTVVAKAQEFSDIGVPVRTVTLIITDGADEHSRRHTAASVRKLVRELLLTEMHIIAAMGVDNGSTNFHQVFEEMGILPQWVLTPGNTPSELRAAFQFFSQSAVRASQGAASFSQTALQGFGAP